MIIDVAAVQRHTKANPGNIAQIWPLVTAAMQTQGVDSLFGRIGLAATITIETAHRFFPTTEFGPKAYFDKYDTGDIAARLGNTPAADGDGYRLRGRGLIEVTGEKNYQWASGVVGIDLVANPDRMNEPDIAARVAVAWCAAHGVFVAWQGRQWQRGRVIVNGGLNGYVPYLQIITSFLTEVGPLPGAPAAKAA